MEGARKQKKKSSKTQPQIKTQEETLLFQLRNQGKTWIIKTVLFNGTITLFLYHQKIYIPISPYCRFLTQLLQQQAN